MKEITSLKGLQVHACKTDPVVSLKIPGSILKALAQRSLETGHSMESEIIVRLAHSVIDAVPDQEIITQPIKRRRT